MVHDLDYTMPWQPWAIPIKETRDYKEAMHSCIMQTAKRRSADMLRWIPPTVGYVKLNFDGSSIRECGIGGCGGLIRDSSGKWVTGYTKSLGYCNAYIAELWGVYEGLCLAKARGLVNILVELDSLQIVGLLQNDQLDRSDGWCLLRRIREIIKATSWQIRFQHAYREPNNCAHLLARMEPSNSRFSPL